MKNIRILSENFQFLVVKFSIYLNRLGFLMHHKTYNKTCVTSKNSDQPVHPPSMARVLIYSIFNSLEAVEGTCHQQRL